MAQLTITGDDNGAFFTIKKDDTFSIVLKENPTTGFRWKRIDDANIISLESKKFLMPEDPQVGEGGTRQFTFKAKSTGTAQIRLQHWCEWEGDQSIIEHFVVNETDYIVVMDGLGGMHMAGPADNTLRNNFQSAVLDLTYFAGVVNDNGVEVFLGFDGANDFVPVLRDNGNDIGLIMLDGLGGLHFSNLGPELTSIRPIYFGDNPEANIHWAVSILRLD